MPSAGAPFVVVTNPNLSPSPNADDSGAYMCLQDKILQAQVLKTFSRKKQREGGRPHVNSTLPWANGVLKLFTTSYRSTQKQDNNATGNKHFTIPS